jgi:hypothetical protein
MNTLDQSLLSQQEVNNRMQYWYSKYCNGVTREERQIYMNLYKAYISLNDLYINEHRYN